MKFEILPLCPISILRLILLQTLRLLLMYLHTTTTTNPQVTTYYC